MPFFVYVAIMAVALFSVALEWDSLVAPSSTTWHEMQAVGELGKPPAQRDAVQPPPAAVAPQPLGMGCWRDCATTCSSVWLCRVDGSFL